MAAIVGRVIPTSYRGSLDLLRSATVGRRVTAIYIDPVTEALYQVTGLVEAWPHRPWSTCIRSHGERFTVVEAWRGSDPLPHPLLVAVLEVS